MASRKGQWGTGLAGAIAVHVALALAMVLSVKITSPPKELPAVIVRLVQAWRRPPTPAPRPLPRPRARPAAPAPSPAPRTLAAAPAAPALSAAPARPQSAPADDLAAVRGVLRGSVGCADPGLYHLSADEKAKCARMLQAHVDPDLHLEAPIDPAKRAWFEDSLRARHAGRYMPVGPPGDIRPMLMKVGGVGGKVSAHQVSIGPLHLGLPPGAFNDDDAPPP